MARLSKDERALINSRNGALGGRPRGSVSTQTLTAVEARKYIVSFVTARLEPLLTTLYTEAVKGSIPAAQELLNRGYGKPVQGVELSGKEGAPIVFMPLELIQKHALQVIEGEVTNTAKNIEAPKDHDSSL